MENEKRLKLKVGRTIAVTLPFFIITMFWQAYDTILPQMLSYHFGLSSLVYGMIMGIDNVAGLFLLPIFGALSDRKHSKLGRRTPFVLVGTIAGIVFFVLMYKAIKVRRKGEFCIKQDSPSSVFCVLPVALSNTNKERWNNMKIKAIIFDKDGTLTKIESFWKEPIEKTCVYITEQCGKTQNENLRHDLECAAGFCNGKLIPESLVIAGTNKLVVAAWLKVLAEHGVEIKDSYSDDFSKKLTDMCATLGKVEAVGNLKKILSALKANGYLLGIITSDLYDAAVSSMQKLGVLEQFDYIVAADQVIQPKPAKDAWEKFEQQFGLKPEETLMVGDSDNDMLFANNCGLVGVLYQAELPAQFPVGAAYGINDLSEIPNLLSMIYQKQNSLWPIDPTLKKIIVVSDCKCSRRTPNGPDRHFRPQ